MPAFLGGPSWPELDGLLTRHDFGAALRLAETNGDIDLAERQLVIGVCHAMWHNGDQAAKALTEAFQAFGPDRPPRAAAAAVFLGRMHFFVHDNPHVANGWFARARSLVGSQPDCLEHALAWLPLPGCDMPDVGVLRESATAALDVARRLGDRNLEAKALADLGTANVSLALVDDGMARLDEAMTMVMAGEAESPFARAEVVCNLLSACARVGDLERADEWTRAAELQLGLGVEGPAFLYAHCRSALGLILCDLGRWNEAEVALRLAAQRATRAGPRSSGQARAALAWLWVLQGRLSDAERLVTDRRDHLDALLPLAEVHLARDEYAEAIGVAHQARRLMGDDRVRTARLISVCVEAELARGNRGAARAEADELERLAAGVSLPVLTARAALGRGRVADAEGEKEAAIRAYGGGLRALSGSDWPLIRAELHLCLARALAPSEASAAITEARAAHLGFERIGSPHAKRTAALLNSLGVAATAQPVYPDSTAALTKRERVVLGLLREGMSNQDMAARLHNSVRTIEHHVSSILGKLGLRSRAEAAVYAASREMAVDRPRA